MKYQIRFSTLIVLFLTFSCIVGLNFTPRKFLIYTRMIRNDFGSMGDKLQYKEYGWPLTCLIVGEKRIRFVGDNVENVAVVTAPPFGWSPWNFIAADAVTALGLLIASRSFFQMIVNAYVARKNKPTL